ncbi:MAG: hypothetical protein AAF693_19270 [Bacteroidota bacterium]
MSINSDNGNHTLSLSIASGFVDFEITIPLAEKDFNVIQVDAERAAFLQAALHHPFQLKETSLSTKQQRNYLDVILHAPKAEVEKFLTEKDHGSANGAISNMTRITCSKDQTLMRKGQWFL